MNDSGVRLLRRLRGHHTAVLRRSRARVHPASGRKAVLDAVDGGLAHSLFRARKQSAGTHPNFKPVWRSTSPHHQARVGHPPIILAVDRGFSTRNNEASGAGRRRADRHVAPFGLVTSELRYFEHRASF